MGNGLPAWGSGSEGPLSLLRVVRTLGITGVLAFLLAAVLGVVPGIRSPIMDRFISTDARAATPGDLVERHFQVTDRLAQQLEQVTRQGQETTRIWRSICRGVWRDNPPMQRTCDE